MDETELVEAVQADAKTELSRLGSSKSLYADTEGEMEPAGVLAAAADDAHHAAETFAGWVDDGLDGAATAAEVATAHHESITGKLDDHEAGDPPAIVEFLRGVAGDVQRLSALVGWTLVADAKASQCSGFFTGQADPQTASLFRGFGDEYEDAREDALATLATVCAGDDDWERATAAAVEAVEAAYDEYFETLESLGVNPKPVC